MDSWENRDKFITYIGFIKDYLDGHKYKDEIMKDIEGNLNECYEIENIREWFLIQDEFFHIFFDDIVSSIDKAEDLYILEKPTPIDTYDFSNIYQQAIRIDEQISLNPNEYVISIIKSEGLNGLSPFLYFSSWILYLDTSEVPKEKIMNIINKINELYYYKERFSINYLSDIKCAKSKGTCLCNIL